MATIEFDLQDGLPSAGGPLKRVVLRDLDAGELIECGRDSEVVAEGSNGPVMVASPTLMGVNVLCRRIKRVGDLDGPLTPALLGKFSAVDFELLQAKSDELDVAASRAVQELLNRGRSADGSA